MKHILPKLDVLKKKKQFKNRTSSDVLLGYYMTEIVIVKTE